MGDIQIHCKYDALLEVSKLRAYKKNRNQHTAAQVERLAKILEYQGLRAPVVVVGSVAGVTDGKTIAKGHCTVEAIKKNGWLSVPVVFQNFDSDEQLYAYVQSDNAISAWSDLDFSKINIDLGDLGPDLDIDLLGIQNFFIEPADKEFDPNQEYNGMPEFDQQDKTAFRSLIVHFKTNEDIQEFANLIKQPITDKTKSLWYPKAEIEHLMDKRYQNES